MTTQCAGKPARPPLLLATQSGRIAHMIDKLLDHQKIGIDLDGTLIEHPHSRRLQKFIIDHPDKEFHIVTFRSHGMQHNIARDLRISTTLTQVPLGLNHFAGVHNIPDTLYENMVRFDRHDPYYCWKADKCKELGCTVIVDDVAAIGPYCEAIDILYIHPDSFGD